MKKILFIIFIALLLMAAISKKIVRDRAIVRSGPGIFFNKIGTLQKDDAVVVELDEDGWLKIDFSNDSYISAKALKKPKQLQGVFEKMGESTTDLQATRHGLSAGIKGFAAKFTKSIGSFEEFQDIYNNTNINSSLYRNLKQSQKQYQKQIRYSRKKNRLSDISRDRFTADEVLVGNAFASTIAAMGLYHNSSIEEFLNVFGNIVAESTEFYDQRFYFYILDTDRVNAYACPGGIIFLTKGLLNATKNEAELAFVITHEMAHAIKQHGLQEMAERETLIKAESAFDELDNELDMLGVEQDAKMVATEEELEQELFSFYENVFAGRLEKYEFEADEIGLKYMVRCGYSANNALSILSRLVNSSSKSTNEHYTNSQLRDRVANLQRVLMKYSSYENISFTNWKELKKSLR